MDETVTQLRQTLHQQADENQQLSGQRYFKEAVKTYGVKTADVTTIGKTYYKTIKNKEKSEIFKYCEDLWQSGYLEEAFIACNWSYYLHPRYEEADFHVFQKWLNEYVDNWASCDTLCNHTVGTYLGMFPHMVTVLKEWAVSENRWLRRASAVSLIIPARNGKFQKEVLEIATILLTDGEDLVQKGYGWLLKVSSQHETEPVYDFVMAHKAIMPRTALRYAIEKMSPELRKEAMKRD